MEGIDVRQMRRFFGRRGFGAIFRAVSIEQSMA